MVSDAAYKRTFALMRARAKAIAQERYRKREAQKLARKFRRQHNQASELRDKYRARKGEWGTVVLVGKNGKRLPPGSKRKAIPVYVTKTGKKRLYVRTQLKNPYALRPLDNIKFSSSKNLRQITKKFQIKVLKEVGRGKLIRASRARKKTGSRAEQAAITAGLPVTPGEFSEGYQPPRGEAFNETMVRKLATSISRALKSQKSKQVYLLTALAEIEGQQGREVVEVTFSLGRSDQHFFKEHPRAFVRHAFYASFAQQLAFLGYVTSGSSNHIRRVTGAKTVTEKVWTKYHKSEGHTDSKGENMEWQGNSFNIVDLLSLEWKIERT